MDMRIDISKTSRTMYRAKAAALSLLLAGLVYAATTFIANDQPWGYISPPALSSANFKNTGVLAFTPWFEEKTFKGELLAYPVGTDGSVSVLAPKWRASIELGKQHHLTGRNIATTDGAGDAIPFIFDDLTDDQQLEVESADVVNFVRGDRSNDGGTFRLRDGMLGTIIHSAPVYLGKPVAGYVFDGYLDYAETEKDRDGRVFVGANDGMLHAFDADSGKEVFGYIPSMVIPNLVQLTKDPYAHQYFVDGFLTLEDVQYDNSWHSVLVGGLGAGGRGYYALDVTDPDAASDTDAADKILWEYHSGSDGAGNIGFSYSRPSIVRLEKDGVWAAVFGNGYLSTDGKASLFVVNIETGELIRELVVDGGAGNGLSSPTAVDSNEDGFVDRVYAGDLNGNVWKFDLLSKDPAGWKVALGGWPFFSALSTQPITTAPEVGRHSSGHGLMVYVGTGRLFSGDDGSDKSVQAVYGLWDNGSTVGMNTLREQTLKSAIHPSGEATRTVTNESINWESNKGWFTNLVVAGANVLDNGERVIQDLLLRDGRIAFMSVNPTVGTGDNWFIQLDANSGGAPGKTIVDTNADLVLDFADNVDGDGVNGIQDVPEDRVVGQYQDFGLASRPVVGALSRTTDSALINHLTAISPLNPHNPPIDPNDPGGLAGGHFDLDTSSKIYGFNAGFTDGHVHEWDDKNDLTVVNYLDLAGGGGNPLHEINMPGLGIDKDAVFLLTIANSDLSSGGRLEINSTSIAVTDYERTQLRYLTGKLKDWEAFPAYKLGEPTPTQAAAGVQQLTSLKMSFDTFAILNGKLIPSNTGCVKANKPGKKGEYRNGALMLQALDASDVSGGFVHDKDNEQYIAGSMAIHDFLGYAKRGLFWESTMFWHWDPAECYGDDGWQQAYNDCFQGNLSCVAASADQKGKAGKTKKKDKKKKDEPVIDPPEEEVGETGDTGTASSDPGHNVSNTTVGGSNDMGRLFWKELIPEE